MSLVWRLFWFFVAPSMIAVGPFVLEASSAGRVLLGFTLVALWAFALNQWLKYRARAGWVAYQLHPKDMLSYLCKDAKWALRFGADRLAWFKGTQLAIRDELRQGRRLRVHGRPAGKWGDGTFRHPADFIEPDFWAHGDLNWIRLLNAEYVGDIDAYNRGSGERPERSFDDVKFSRQELENIWPRRGWASRLLWPTPFEPFEYPPSGQDDPWAQERRTPQPSDAAPVRKLLARADELVNRSVTSKSAFRDWRSAYRSWVADVVEHFRAVGNENEALLFPQLEPVYRGELSDAYGPKHKALLYRLWRQREWLRKKREPQGSP